MKSNLKYIRISLLLFIGLLYAFTAKTQVNVSVSIDTSMMLIGDQTKVVLQAELPTNYNIVFPLFTDTIIDKLEILNIANPDTVITNNNMLIRHEYLVTCFDSGWYTIPPARFVVSDASQMSDTLMSNAIYFGVMTMPLDTANAEAITDIKAPEEAPLTFREILPFAGIGLGVLLILFLAYYIYMRLARKEPIFARKEKPKEPAHVIAFRDLDALKESKLWQQGKIKEFYSELTEIIRTYIEDLYGIAAMEMTTDETIDSIIKSGVIDKALKNELFDVLSRADFVKFAKANPLVHENEASIKFAYEFVIKTKPVEILTDTDEQNEKNNQESNETKK